jgi:hypothetical protein
MSDSIITVENLSKRYKLGVIGATTLRESVERAWHRLRGRDWREEMGPIGAAKPRPIETEDRRLKTEDLLSQDGDVRRKAEDSLGGSASDEVDAKQSGIEDPENGLQSSVFSLQSSVFSLQSSVFSLQSSV